MANVAVIANYPLFHGFFPNGDPLIGGKLYTYQAGTSTPAAAYHDAAATIPHQNPIILDDRGEALVHIRGGNAVGADRCRRGATVESG